jgi:hypothetical protein
MKKILIASFLFSAFGTFAQNASTEVVTFSLAENVGTCRVVFTRESGEELEFWNPDLGAFADSNNPCMISGQYQDSPFSVTWQMGSMQIYTQAGGNEVVQTPMLQSIELAQ